MVAYCESLNEGGLVGLALPSRSTFATPWSKSDGKMQLNGTFYGYFEVIPWWFNSNPIISMSGIALSIQHNCQREWMYGARLTGSTMTEV